ncbi:MAG TPA: condensation domain-containing protein, partial [Chthonomonadaceae bacterium]|nr:condensation domain-containing protein [Chthonomonadaceae bacterium]
MGAKLPGYMIPSAFVFLEALPLSPNGKIDRKALPAPDAPQSRESFVAPRTPVEEGIAEIWSEVLRVPQVGIHANFFELGGHSLLATQVISRIRTIFQVELPLRSLFESPTVSALAERVALTNQDERQAPPLVRSARKGRLPLSFAQQRLWFLDQLEPGSPLYNMPTGLRLSGVLRVEALQQSLDELVRRHESLRTTFALEEGDPYQVIHLATSVDLPRIDLSTLSEERRDAEAQRLVQDEACRAFDLITGPLFRASLIRLGEQEHILLLTMHHIVSDGWSMGVLAREFTTLYNAFQAGQPSPLPELPLQYGDYAMWQRGWLEGAELQRQTDYWKQHLAGAPTLLELPTDRPRPPVLTHHGARQNILLSPELSVSVKQLGQREGATLFMTLLAAFNVLLSRYSGQEDIVVGTPIANRTQADLESLIGFFVNTLVLRGDLSGDPSFVDLLGRIRETSLGAYAHQDLPFEKLVDELHPERSLSHSPIFQVMFILQNTPRGAAGLEGLQIKTLGGEGVNAKFDLLLTATETQSGLRLVLEYNTDLFDGETIGRMLGHMQMLLEGIVTDPQCPMSRLPLLTQAERHQLLVEWNDTHTPFPDQRLHQAVEQQADRAPDAIALRFEHHKLTYQQLDQRANQLAHHLKALGVGKGAFVGVAMQRSLDLMVALLGVLKAGAAYVPFDPDYPAERLAYMLEDCRVPVLLSQSAVAAHLPHPEATLLCLDRDAKRIAQQPTHRLDVDVDAEEAAYVIYTSGSTGRPKGVVIPHRAIQNHMFWMQHAFPITPQDRLLQKTPISFDASVWECWAALMVGAELVIARPGGHMDPEYLVDLVQKQGITTLKLVPSLLQMLLTQERFGHCSTLRQVFCGAEALSRELAQQFFDVFGKSVALHNLYGPTEAAIDATGY